MLRCLYVLFDCVFFCFYLLPLIFAYFSFFSFFDISVLFLCFCSSFCDSYMLRRLYILFVLPNVLSLPPFSFLFLYCLCHLGREYFSSSCGFSSIFEAHFKGCDLPCTWIRLICSEGSIFPCSAVMFWRNYYFLWHFLWFFYCFCGNLLLFMYSL